MTDSSISPSNKSDHPLAISFKSVSKIFGGVQALDKVSFEVAQGEIHCLAGENGSGKSTLIKIITGVYQPEHGVEMEYFGKKLGGYLLSVAIKNSFLMGSSRLWVHTCSLDHKNALNNYISRGMKIFKSEILAR